MFLRFEAMSKFHSFNFVSNVNEKLRKEHLFRFVFKIKLLLSADYFLLKLPEKGKPDKKRKLFIKILKSFKREQLVLNRKL